MVRQINAAGLQIIKDSESLQLTAYPDPGSGAQPWTIGWGHTGPEVHPGMRINELYAETLLQADLARTEAGVGHLAVNANDNQFSALVSFAFNEGLEHLRTSTLLAQHNAGNYASACAQFSRWIYAEGKPMPGLITRRQREGRLYAEPCD